MAKKTKWTKAMREAASKRMKAKYAKQRKEKEIEVAIGTAPLKMRGLSQRLTQLQDAAQELADDIENLKEDLDKL